MENVSSKSLNSWLQLCPSLLRLSSWPPTPIPLSPSITNLTRMIKWALTLLWTLLMTSAFLKALPSGIFLCVFVSLKIMHKIMVWAKENWWFRSCSWPTCCYCWCALGLVFGEFNRPTQSKIHMEWPLGNTSPLNASLWGASFSVVRRLAPHKKKGMKSTYVSSPFSHLLKKSIKC